MRTYDITVGDQEFHLRLTLLGQKALEAKHPGSDALDVVLSAVTNATNMLDVLAQALTWNGNDNPKGVTADRLYDMLVDDGYAGQKDFGGLIIEIARNAGLIDAATVEKIYSGISDEETAPVPQLSPVNN